MDDSTINSVANAVNTLNIQISNPLLNKSNNNECSGASCCDVVEEPITDSEEYLSEPLRYKEFQYSSSASNNTLIANDNMSEGSVNYINGNSNFSFSSIQIPIVGYEIMEERARFTVYKLRIENKASGASWYVFRRYTDFVRLCNHFKNTHPHVVKHLPRKRWLKNNFDPIFLEERVNGLQTLVNAILSEQELINMTEVQDFFCLNEPPTYTESNEESRAVFEALEETINDLKLQLQEREVQIDDLQDKLHSTLIENDNLKKMIRKSAMNCQKCEKEYQNLSKIIQ